jgi:NAD(P)-dependent dehydrogenase (short-subunit alcohol dehydrogenase family)
MVQPWLISAEESIAERSLNTRVLAQTRMPDQVLEKFRLDGKTCVVTGASRGLGRMMAIALGEAGANVVTVARTQEALDETTSVIRSLGRRAISVRCNLRDSGSIAAMVDQVLAEFGQIDVLVNNAGGGDFKPLVEMSDDQWYRIVDLNLSATFRVCRAVGPHMIKRRRGKVINMSSMYGLIGDKNVTAYCASKGAVIQLTRALALEWAEHNITVNVLAPGYIYTERTSSIFDNPVTGAPLISRIPIGRVGQTGDLGPLIVYLASDASDFMTGSVIVIDGGQTAA